MECVGGIYSTFLEPLGLSDVLRLRKSPNSFLFASLMIAHDRISGSCFRLYEGVFICVLVVSKGAHVRPRLLVRG